MGRIIDADSHLLEPLDVWERHIEPRFRDRALRFRQRAEDGRWAIHFETDQRARFRAEDFLGTVAGYGQKEDGAELGSFDIAEALDSSFETTKRRLEYLADEGFEAQILYPSIGLVVDGLVEDPELAAAHCRAYNRWAQQLTDGYRDRLLIAAHVSLRDPAAAVDEIERVAADGVRTLFLGATPIGGRSWGHPDYDQVWAAAQHHDLSIGIHLVVHPHYWGAEWHREPSPGFMWVSMNVIQDARMALTTMVYDGVFERFPDLRVATVESSSGWVCEWIDRLDHRFHYMGHTSGMGRPAAETFARNIWINADPDERALPHMVELLGDERFMIGSDYPHAEGFTRPVERARTALGRLPSVSIERILGDNCARFLNLSTQR